MFRERANGSSQWKISHVELGAHNVSQNWKKANGSSPLKISHMLSQVLTMLVKIGRKLMEVPCRK